MAVKYRSNRIGEYSMLAFRTQVMMIAIMIAAIVCIINMLRKKKLDFKFGLGWLFVAVCILVLAAFPVLLDKLAYLAGIASPVNMLFFLGFALTVVLIFALSIAVSRLSDRVKKLSQEIAIIRRDMYDRVTELEMK